MNTQLAVLGGGPGGYTAAFLAADVGLEVTIVEQDARLGGTCLLRGCIPSKALLHASDIIEQAREAAAWGITFGQPQIDVAILRQRTQKVMATLTGGLAGLARQRKVRVIQARGTFQDSRTLRLEGGNSATYAENTLAFEHCMVASGSRPAMPKVFAIDSPLVMDSTAALALPEVPATMLVVGGGYIGLEMGSVYARLGSKVTVVEMTDGLLPGVDRDLVRPLHKRLEQLLAGIRLNTKALEVRPSQDGKGLDVTFETSAGPGEPRPEGSGRSAQRFDRVLVCVGRQPNTDHLGLENTKVQLAPSGFIVVDQQRRTAEPHIFAVGDVVPGPMLAHKAFHEAKTAVEVISEKNAAFDARVIPAVVFTDPEVAWAGLTAQQAAEQKLDVKVATYPWAASGRAHSLGRTEGLTKMFVDSATDRVLGVGIVGVGAGGLISEAVLAIEMGCTAGDLAAAIHPHPTMSETVGGAADVYLGLATEIYRPRKK